MPLFLTGALEMGEQRKFGMPEWGSILGPQDCKLTMIFAYLPLVNVQTEEV